MALIWIYGEWFFANRHKSQYIMNHVTRLKNNNNANDDMEKKAYWKRNAVICFNIRVIVLLVVAELNALKIPFSIMMIASVNNVREETTDKKNIHTENYHDNTNRATIKNMMCWPANEAFCRQRSLSNGMLLNRIWLKH